MPVALCLWSFATSARSPVRQNGGFALPRKWSPTAAENNLEKVLDLKRSSDNLFLVSEGETKMETATYKISPDVKSTWGWDRSKTVEATLEVNDISGTETLRDKNGKVVAECSAASGWAWFSNDFRSGFVTVKEIG